ncbi:MAG: TIGR03087 family PEP-CTERM/XrtA system glycosyltransferase [Halioglobus sp.]
MKTPLLFLCHRIPYPPNKGDKIRSFHLLHHLSKHFTVYLATFIDDPADWPWVPEVEKFCTESLFLELRPWQATLRSLAGLFSGQALSVPYYGNRQMQRWVSEQVKAHDIQHVLVFSSAMAQFALDPALGFARKVVDFVDIDSDKWDQYAQQKPYPMKAVYQREARKLFDFEQRLTEEFDAGLFVSSSEADLFRQMVPGSADKIGYYNNGVNSDYFCPLADRQSPYTHGERVVVFTGAMDYWPNIDAALWFADKVFPQLRDACPDVSFYIVGSNPSREVSQLARRAGIQVTGRVEDIRPYLQHADVAVAPMQIARGVQNKVLEAMAMELPVVVSQRGLEGIDCAVGEDLLLADTPADYLDYISRIFAGEFAPMGERARSHVKDAFDWDNNLPEVVLLLEQAGHAPVNVAVSHG